MFTQKAKEKLEEILSESELRLSWRHGASSTPVYLSEKMVQYLLKEGMTARKAIEEAITSQDSSEMLPEEIYAYLSDVKRELVKNKLFGCLEKADFSKEYAPFWEMLEEREEMDEVLEELAFEIHHWIEANIGFKIDPNMDALIGNHAESVEMSMDALSWSTLQEMRVKKNPGDWLFVTLYDILKEHEKATSFAKEFNNLGAENELLISTKSWARYSAEHITHTVNVASSLKEYIEKYPEGVDAQNYCVRIEFESDEVLHVALEKDIPFLATLAASEDTVCHLALKGINKIGIAKKENHAVLEPAPEHFSKRFKEILVKTVAGFVQQKLDEGEYDYIDSGERSLIHYIYASGDSGMLTKWIQVITEESELGRMEDYFFRADRYGVSVLTLCKAIEDEFSNFVLNTLYGIMLRYLPAKNATAALWEVESKHYAISKGERYFLIECHEQNPEGGPLDIEFLVLHKESKRFLNKTMRELDSISTALCTTVCLNGEWVEGVPF